MSGSQRELRSSVDGVNSPGSDGPHVAPGVLNLQYAPQAVWAIYLFASSVVGLGLFAETHPAFMDKCDDFYTPPNDPTALSIFGAIIVVSILVGLALRRRMHLLWVLAGLAVQAFAFFALLQPPAGFC